MYCFENKRVTVNEGTGEFYSRIIASWAKEYAPYKIFDNTFKDWLISLGLTDEDVENIYELADCGKMEIEHHADQWLQQQGIDVKKERHRKRK